MSIPDDTYTSFTRTDTDAPVISSSRRSKSKDQELTSEEALKKLIQAANHILAEHRKSLPKISVLTWTREFLSRKDSKLIILSVILLIAFYAYGAIKSDRYQFRLTGILVEAIMILLMLIWNGFLYFREKRASLLELTLRVEKIIEQMKTTEIKNIQEMRIPFVPSITFTKVFRDGIESTIPTYLLVEGDIVELFFGDVAPCQMQFIAPTDADLSPSKLTLNTNEVFKPSFFSEPEPQLLLDNHISNRGRYRFKIIETPWANNLKCVLNQRRPATVLCRQAQVLEDVFFKKAIFIIFAIVFLMTLPRYIVYEVIKSDRRNQALESLIVLPVYCILPILPFTFPTLWLVVRSFSNATVLVLFELLQISKTDYEDDDEVDEFDAEAPPPTKNVHLDRAAVWSKFRYLLTQWDLSALPRTNNLFESLGSTTVICSLDREGTISSPYPSVKQIFFPIENEETTRLDVAEDPEMPFGVRFEDQDWSQYMSSLKPLGLNLLLNTTCGALQGRKRIDQHQKWSKLHRYAKTKPARQSCLCQLGKEIGFTDDALQAFVRRKEIYAFAPYHPSLRERIRDDQWELPIMVSLIYEEEGSGSYQLLSEGHAEVILDSCSDYWDGRGLRPMSQAMEKKIYDFYQNAIVNDLQCIAYAYRPINTENGNPIPFLDSPSSSNIAFIMLPPSEDYVVYAASGSNVSITTSNPPSLSTTPTDLSRSQLIRLKHLQAGQLEANLHDFVFDDRVTHKDEEKFYREVINGQIFLSMATLGHEPKVDVRDFIEDLNLAGIRFVYFSPTAERESKAYAEELGLETDWNSCILLSSPGDANSSSMGYREPHDIKARLPRGVGSIRSHLTKVDDIPLHVSLFAECTPSTTLEMMKIFQEYGEVVCCIGSSLNAANAQAFAVADVSVAMEPMHTRVQMRNGMWCASGRGVKEGLAVGAMLNSLPCALFMQYDTSLYALTDVIREARRLTNAGAAFLIGSYLATSILLILSSCLFLPPIFTGYQILWIMWIICPMLAFSFLFNPHEADTMTTMTGKNNEHLKDFKRFVIYFVLRFFLPICFCIAVFVSSLYYFDGQHDLSFVFGSYGNVDWLKLDSDQQWALVYAQNYALFAFVWYLACTSSTFVHRTLSLRGFPPFKNRMWVAMFFAR
ncbi:7716_t:CDS:10 [Paraglomus brasilianum]|uniref:7716_t:CDS:1 n=1 Tax=Paraglomus brasilianum TaxID=144538 RepID=A0A9N9CL60_9GLOM|nr:7716_t:CDS:10 [Paraglomus brasilianum]